MPHLTTYEKAGIPSVFIIYGDQRECWEWAARLNGVPGLRTVHASRTVPGPEDIDTFIEDLVDGLTRPLTDEEQEGGMWAPREKRILFEGTLEDAEEFYMQTDKVPNLQNASIARYTDGLPIVVPTEGRVEAMLKGTSHRPEEVISFHDDHKLGDRSSQMGNSGRKGDAVRYLPLMRTATVENVATIAVMAGCKPEYMPVLLAIAESGGGCSDGRGGVGFCVSGPIGREIDMNFDVNVLGPGNQANRSIGRAAELMWRNFGGNIPAVTNVGVWGNALTNCIPENAEGLPPGWKGLNEEYGFKKDDNVLVIIPAGAMHRVQFSPGGYRALQKSGHGGIARRLDVKGIPGPHNWLEFFMPGLWASREGALTILMLPEMAQHLYEYGFKSKDEIYEWLYKQSFTSMKEYKTHSWPDMRTNAWMGIEKTSGKHWKELPDDYMVPSINDPRDNNIIVTGGGEESAQWMAGRSAAANPAFNIDTWR
ncbi:MAG: hypothetical protein V3S02_05610 [Dehalococcoidales bacterium]